MTLNKKSNFILKLDFLGSLSTGVGEEILYL